jgi:hypothetical protein
MTIDLNQLHHDLHAVTGQMATRYNRATAADLQRWAVMLRTIAEQMAAAAITSTMADELSRPRKAARASPDGP